MGLAEVIGLAAVLVLVLLLQWLVGVAVMVEAAVATVALFMVKW